VVAGVTPGKGGQREAGVPVFDTVAQAVTATGADASIIYVPARFTADAILEAVDAGIRTIVTITEGVPVHDMLRVTDYLLLHGVRMIGPNCPGIITPGEAKVGIIPGNICMPGRVGVVSRSGTLTYEVLHALTERGIGQSTAVGIGGDPVQGTKFVDVLQAFQDDPGTDLIVMIGEIGGTDEETAAQFVKDSVTKPVVGFIAGQTAPPGKRMGHAGAIISGGMGTAEGKVQAFQAAGIAVARHPDEIAEIVARMV
ncbi:MAG TPA: succinate--CoA ligase subunit alpha, partial [Anaerolineae bacterium]|nr:succinate--CoA ligase subunit alpha [Anaerolineae bacterium]